MSSYVHFYIKNQKSGQLTYLMSYSRSSNIYKACNNAGLNGRVIKTGEGLLDSYRVVAPVKVSQIAELKNSMSELVEGYDQHIKDCQEEIDSISKWINPISEKLEVQRELKSSIEEWKELRDEAVFALDFFIILSHIADDGGYSGNADDIIYAGIDAAAEEKPNQQ